MLESCMTRSTPIPLALCLVALAGSSACVEDSSAAQAGRTQTQQRQTGRTQRAVRSTQPSPDSLRFVEHADYIRPGSAASSARVMLLRNPYEGDRQGATVGANLSMSYNGV